jgi:hypothetical protein
VEYDILCSSRRVNTVNDRKVGVSRDVVQGLGLGPGQRRVQGITAISILHPRSLLREMRRIDVLFFRVDGGDGSAYSTCSLLELRGLSASRDDESNQTRPSSSTRSGPKQAPKPSPKRDIQHSSTRRSKCRWTPGFWNPSLPSKRQHENRVSSASSSKQIARDLDRLDENRPPWISRLKNAFTRFLRHHGSIVSCRDPCRGSGIGFVAFKRRIGAGVRDAAFRSSRKPNAPSVRLSFQLSVSVCARSIERG